jgi:hypothetical protein
LLSRGRCLAAELAPLLLVVFDGGLDGILREPAKRCAVGLSGRGQRAARRWRAKRAELAHGAVELNGWKLQVLGNVRVLDSAGLVERLALKPFSGI